MERLSTGEVAERAGVGVETIRFYEREGLIEEPPRTGAGYRQFPPRVVTRLRFIRSAKDLGFTLREIRELLSLRAGPGRNRDDARRMAREKLDEVDGKIDALQRIRHALASLVDQCRGGGVAEECPILEAMEPDED